MKDSTDEKIKEIMDILTKDSEDFLNEVESVSREFDNSKNEKES